MVRTLLALSILFATVVTHGTAADTVRLCSYNVLNYSARNEDGRIPRFAEILNEIRPHILVCQEVDDASLGPRFIADVLTWAPFAAAPYIDGPDSDVQLLYDQNLFDFLGQTRIDTKLRQIGEFTLATKPEQGFSPDTIVVYSMHLKASRGFAERRGEEIDSLLKYISDRKYVVVSGDLNLYTPMEAAYTKLTDEGFIDPLGNDWQRDNSRFAGIYSQCTRKDQFPSCGGGVSGGLDDRFDFIFLSPTLNGRYVGDSYETYGNDGVPRLNSSINDPPNTLVSSDLADALFCASDHLPIFLEFVLGDLGASVDPRDLPTPSLSVRFDGTSIIVEGCTVGGMITVHDLNGRLEKSVMCTDPTMLISVGAMPNGFYMVSQLSDSVGISVIR